MVCDGRMNAQTLERPVLDEPQLSAANRCDACGARAWVRATMPSGGQLYFCGHHANEHLPSLVGAGAQILDELHLMNDCLHRTRLGGTHGCEARGGTNGSRPLAISSQFPPATPVGTVRTLVTLCWCGCCPRCLVSFAIDGVV